MNIEVEELILGNIKAGRVRIYKISTHKFFTEKENEIYKSKEHNKTTDIDAAIAENKEIRYAEEKEFREKEIIPVWENDVVRLALHDHNEEKADMQLIKEIVSLEVYHLEILNQIINNGCYIFEKEYMFFTATTGQQRHKTVVLIEKDFYKRHERNINCGLDIERINKMGGQNAGKHISYNALILSTSVPFEKKIDLKKCVVVKGLTTVVNELVKYLDVNTMKVYKNYIYYKNKDGIEGIEIEHTDGAGMFLPGEQSDSFQVRGRYIKGAMFPFDFRRFALDVAHNTKITDYKGVVHDIIEEDIRYIFTTSQFKNCDYYKSWDEYREICEAEGIELTVNSWANKPTDKVRFAYQFLQTLLYDADISKIQENVCNYLNLCKNNLEFALEMIGLKFNPDKPKALAEAISIYPNLVYDKRILQNIKDKVANERRYARIGKFWVDGTYTYAMPDMYAFCEYLFMNESNPAGLVPKNQIYSKSFDDKPVTNVCVLRSPHLSGYEYAKRTLIKSDKCKEWFVSNDTVLSIHDLNSKTLQLDVDGDEVMVCSDKAIWDLAEDKPPLYYEMSKATGIQIDNEAIFETLKKAFENCLVGFISNGETRLWNVDSKEEIDDDLICIETAMNNYSIDYPKTGVNLNLEDYPKIWEKHLKYVGDFANDIKPTVGKPYFFVDKERKSHQEVAARIENGKSQFEKRNESIMNRINATIDKGVQQNYKYSSTDGEFDYHMLMNHEKREDGKPKYEVRTSNKYYWKLVNLLIELKKQEQKLMKEYDEQDLFEDKSDAENRSHNFAMFDYQCINKIKEVFTKRYYNENLAVNVLVHIYYNQDCLSTHMPNILWQCYGHILVKNISDNLKNGYVPVVKKRRAYKQAVIGNKNVDNVIDELLNKEPVAITDKEFAYIMGMSDDTTASPLAKVVYVLLCMYKGMVLNSSREPKDIWLRINMDRKKTKKRKDGKRVVKHTFSEIDRIAMVSDGKSKDIVSSLEADGFLNIRHIPYKYYEIQFDLKDGKNKFNVPSCYRCLPCLYKNATFTDMVVKKCTECDTLFLIEPNKSKACTCGKTCQTIRLARQKAESYQRKKAAS